MNKQFKALVGAVGIMGALSAEAFEANITVNANIDPAVSLTKSDGTPLPSAVDMTYVVGKGLSGYKTDVKAWSNAEKDLNFRLAGQPQLTNSNGANPIALSVKLDDSALSTVDSSFNYERLFPNGLTDGSIAMGLSISQSDPSEVVAAGRYSGVVGLVVTQGTTKNGL